MKKINIFIIVLLLLISFVKAQFLGPMTVYDPAVHASLNNNFANQLSQGAQQLQQLTSQLQVAQNLYNTAQNALKYQGNPAQILGGITDPGLGNALSPSNIGNTFSSLLGHLNSLGNISSQLQGLVGPSLSIDAIKSQLLAGQTPTNNIAKYQAMEQLFDQQNTQLQLASQQSANLRSQLADLRSQVASSQDQATTDKLNAAITSTSAALATTDATIAQLNQQTQVSAQMIQNRKLMEDAAYQEAYKEVSDQQSQNNAAAMGSSFNNLNKTR